MSKDKMKVFDVETGESMEVFFVDAREMVASGQYTAEDPNAPVAGPDRAELEAKLTEAGVEFFDTDPTEALVLLLEEYEKSKQ